MRILAIVVIYNADWKECNIYKSLFSKSDTEVLLYDNSPEDVNRKYEDSRTHYIHDASNPGVSKAYNAGAEWARGNGFSHVVLFDDDTVLPPEYIGILYNAMEASPGTSVFVPSLSYDGGKKAFSPCQASRLGTRGVRLKPGAYDLGRYLPVNSGACISLDSFFSVGGYNEKIPLDFADFDFFTRLGAKGGRFVLTACTGEQSFSNQEKDTGRLLKRYRSYLRGAAEYGNPAAIRLQVLRHTISLFLRTRRTEFIKLYISFIKHDLSLHRHI